MSDERSEGRNKGGGGWTVGQGGSMRLPALLQHFARGIDKFDTVVLSFL